MKSFFNFIAFLCAFSFHRGVVEKGAGAPTADTDTEFETKVLKGVEGIQKSQDQLVEKYDNLQKETKTAFEELTKVKNQMNSISDFEAKLKKVELAMRREQRMAFGDPVKRISADPEMRQRFNGLIRLACRKDPGVIELGKSMLKDVQERALTTGATPGSTFITPELANEIYNVLATYGIWNTFDVHRLGTSVQKFPVSTARPIAYAVRKLSNRKMVEDSTIAGTSVDCEAFLWGVLLGVETELLQDAEYDVTGYVLDNFGEALSFRLDHLCLTADGTDDENDSGISGVFETGTAATAASGNTTTETTDFEDWVKALTTVAPVVLTRPARWWIHPTTLARTLGVKDGNGRPIFLTATEAPTYGGLGSILGYPVTPAHAAPSANTAGSKIAVFGDPKAHVLGLRQDIGFDASDDFAFDAAKRMFRGLARAGAKTRRPTGLAVVTLAGS